MSASHRVAGLQGRAQGARRNRGKGGHLQRRRLRRDLRTQASARRPDRRRAKARARRRAPPARVATSASAAAAALGFGAPRRRCGDPPERRNRRRASRSGNAAKLVRNCLNSASTGAQIAQPATCASSASASGLGRVHRRPGPISPRFLGIFRQGSWPTPRANLDQGGSRPRQPRFHRPLAQRQHASDLFVGHFFHLAQQ